MSEDNKKVQVSRGMLIFRLIIYSAILVTTFVVLRWHFSFNNLMNISILCMVFVCTDSAGRAFVADMFKFQGFSSFASATKGDFQGCAIGLIMMLFFVPIAIGFFGCIMAIVMWFKTLSALIQGNYQAKSDAGNGEKSVKEINTDGNNEPQPDEMQFPLPGNELLEIKKH